MEQNRQGFLNRNQLKYMVIMAMLIDHVAWAFVPTASLAGQIMHFIGRLTAPTMAYFIVEGYCHTRNVGKYAARLGVFAFISWFAFVYFECGTLPITVSDGHLQVLPYFGVVYTLLLGLLAIWLWDKARWPQWCKVLGIIGICMISVVGDWAMFDVLWCLFLYIYRDKPKAKWLAYAIVGLICCAPMLVAVPWWSYLFMTGVFVVPLILQFCYNGEPGSRNAWNKWFFYIFYPVHLILLGILRWNIVG